MPYFRKTKETIKGKRKRKDGGERSMHVFRNILYVSIVGLLISLRPKDSKEDNTKHSSYYRKSGGVLGKIYVAFYSAVRNIYT